MRICGFDIDEYLKSNHNDCTQQLSLFTQNEDNDDIRPYVYVYSISQLYNVLTAAFTTR